MDLLAHRAFVVAAHPDDDAIGCGGLIATIARGGGTVNVAYLSDGRASHPGSVRFPPERVAELRALEALDALAQLGVRQVPYFFGLHDGELSHLDPRAFAHAVTRLTELLARDRPDAVFAPWRRDPHPDHVAAAAIARAAVATLHTPPPLVEYEVWLSVRGDDRDRPQPGEVTQHELALDAATLARKRAAILAHATQTGAVIDDDPGGFRIGEDLLRAWLLPTERFYVAAR
jgi:LmbE family N-acetylglucosaminyl deacetylase